MAKVPSIQSKAKACSMYKEHGKVRLHCDDGTYRRAMGTELKSFDEDKRSFLPVLSFCCPADELLALAGLLGRAASCE